MTDEITQDPLVTLWAGESFPQRRQGCRSLDGGTTDGGVAVGLLARYGGVGGA